MVALTDMTSFDNGAAAALASANTIVIKIGSSLLVDESTGTVNADRLAGIASDIAMLRDKGQNVVVVSSGAIALGSRALGLTGGMRTGDLPLKKSRQQQPPDRPCWPMPGVKRLHDMTLGLRRSCCHPRTQKHAADI